MHLFNSSQCEKTFNMLTIIKALPMSMTKKVLPIREPNSNILPYTVVNLYPLIHSLQYQGKSVLLPLRLPLNLKTKIELTRLSKEHHQIQ